MSKGIASVLFYPAALEISLVTRSSACIEEGGVCKFDSISLQASNRLLVLCSGCKQSCSLNKIFGVISLIFLAYKDGREAEISIYSWFSVAVAVAAVIVY